MRIGLVVDSGCDLPIDFIRAHAITILPITVRSDLISFEDRRDPEATLRFFREQLGDRAHYAESEPLSVHEVHDLFLRELAAARFAQTQSITEKPQRRFQVARTDHGVQIFHRRLSGTEPTPWGVRVRHARVSHTAWIHCTPGVTPAQVLAC